MRYDHQIKTLKHVGVGVTVAALLSFPFALAHNAGHIHRPNGECVDVGSGRHAHNPEKQDKIPGPGDQYGARWAAEQRDAHLPSEL